MEKEIQENDLVIVANANQFGNTSMIEHGKVVALEGSKALVILAGEDFPRKYNVAELQLSEDVMGQDTPGFFNNQVIDAIRR